MKALSVFNSRTHLSRVTAGFFFALIFTVPTVTMLNSPLSLAGEVEDYLESVDLRIWIKTEATSEAFWELLSHSQHIQQADQELDLNKIMAPLAWVNQFARTLKPASTKLYQKIQNLMESQAELTFQQKKDLAEVILETTFQTQFDAEKLFEKIQLKRKLGHCEICKKRALVDCRCGGKYCVQHVDETQHDCDFDYKTFERELIKKKNPVVVAPKVEKI